MQESPGSDRETIETHSLPSQTSVSNPEITCTAYTKQMHTKKTYIQEHINNIHRETTPDMKLNQRLSSINSNLYMGVLHKFSACSLFLLLNE
jgi:hypothetical protein